MKHLYFFEGVDPAPAESQQAADGALVVAAAWPRRAPEEEEPLSQQPGDWWFAPCYAQRVTHKTKLTQREWSGLIHTHHQRFGLSRICLDPNGGGQMVKREMMYGKQLIEGVETEVSPIGDQLDGPKIMGVGQFIVTMFKRGDPGIEALWPKLPGDENMNDAMFSAVKTALDNATWVLMESVSDWMTERRAEVHSWEEERRWALKNLDAMVEQILAFQVVVRDDGTQMELKRGARVFTTNKKKDFLMAVGMCYVGFLSWLRSEDWEPPMKPEDAVGSYGF